MLAVQRRVWAVLLAGMVGGLLTLGAYALVGWPEALVYLTDVMPAARTRLEDVAGSYNLAKYVGPLAPLVQAAMLVWLMVQGWRERAVDRLFMLGVTAIFLFSPAIWNHYFVLLILPWLVTFAAVQTRGATVALLLAGFLISMASTMVFFPVELTRWPPFLGVVLLLGVQLSTYQLPRFSTPQQMTGE
ncbi:MAG: hypothetical protein HC876_03635 [Chloroflexaceae bacterium]|nr:hypothetical protein [Chloroflexaceae bacterium]NJO04681.1 hypothetical protein [Chloroflexaceae bacterium]